MRRGNARHHLTLSHGQHHCLGFNLGRMQCQAAVTAILERLPQIRELALDATGKDAIEDPIPILPGAHYTMGGVETVCTGVGSGKDDPRWASYPIKVEFSNGGAQFLSGAHVKVAGADGKAMAEFDCNVAAFDEANFV